MANANTPEDLPVAPASAPAPAPAPAPRDRASRAAGRDAGVDCSEQEPRVDWHDDHSPLECRIAFVADTAQVQPIGEVDLATAALVDQRLELVRAAGAGRVILDLRETTLIDSAGLHLALAWQERARRERFAFALAVDPGPVRRCFDAAGIGAALTFVSEAP